MAHPISRRHFLAGTSAAVVLAKAPAALGQQVRELNVWHTEVEPQTVKTIQDTSIAEFEKKFPGFKVKQQALGWGDLNTKLLAALAAGSPPDLTHLNPFMTASLYRKNLLRPMDELIRALGEKDIHEATLKLQYFDGKRFGLQMPGEKLYIGFVHPAEWLAANGGSWVDPKTWRPQLNSTSMVSTLEYLQKLNKYMPGGWSGQKYLDTLAALATGKVSMVYLSGARTIGYIERYAPENMHDPDHFQPMFKSMINDPEYLANPRIQKWKSWHDFMVKGLNDNRFLPIGFSRPDDNVLPFLAELDGSGIVIAP